MNSGARILVVDDEPQIRRWLKGSLEKNGYDVVTAATGGEALEHISGRSPDVLIVDLILPDISGLELTRQVRHKSSTLPIIVLSAVDDEPRKVEALGLGADDYVTKPFGVNELVARIRSVMRRAMASHSVEPVFHCGVLHIHYERREVRVRGEVVKLTPTEYDLLKHLSANMGRILTQATLMTTVWGPNYVDQHHYLRMYMKKLRVKLELDPARPQFLLTEAGVGYWLSPEGLLAAEHAAAG